MINTVKALHGHTSQETAYVVNDYPYGFRLRTSIRYWLEEKKGQGMRACSQTLNPKTGKWNAPKKGTYSVVKAMGLNEQGHVVFDGLRAGGWDDESIIKSFELAYAPLTEYQEKAIKYIRATNYANSITKWEIKGGESTQTPKEQSAIWNKAVALGYQKLG